MNLEDLRAKRTRLQAQLAKATGERADNLLTSLAKADEQIAQHERVLAAAGNPAATAPADGLPSVGPYARPAGRGPAVPIASDRENPTQQRHYAHMLLEHQTREGLLTTQAADVLSNLVDHDPTGFDSLFMRAVANPAYERAFGKLLVHGDAAMMRMDDTERQATEVVMRAQEMRAAAGGMRIGDGPSGGFAIPFVLDPTFTLTSSGAVNPMRDLARVVQITGANEWKGVNTDGVTAAFAAEGDEVGDGTPTLTQPDIKAKKAHVFIPFSVEYAGDVANLTTELGRLVADAKDVLEAEMFLDGAGGTSVEPQGILEGGTLLYHAAGGTIAYADGGGTTVVRVSTGDLYGAQDDLDPRWQPNARWVGSLSTLNTLRQLVASADPRRAQIFDANGNLLGKPYSEASMMPTIGSSTQPLVYGDIRSAYTILDRIGMSVELVNHLVGSSHRPTGQRGLYCWYRVGAGVVNAKAIRVVQTA